RDPEGRYEIHELLRQYAEERLRQDSEAYSTTLNAHSKHYLDMLGSLAVPSITSKQAQACNQIEANLENIRLAWKHAIATKNLTGIGNAEKALYTYYRLRSLNIERNEMFAQAIQMVESLSPTHDQQVILAKLLGRQGELMMRIGTLPQVFALFERATDIQRAENDLIGLAFSLGHLSLSRHNANQKEQAQQVGNEAVQIAEQSG
ncbi:MAG TPA: hypothetical protein PLZ51_07945, partial [Aggregatilineales bacterium]|nr:hypothetical protein [Aggregatilineales bacterium]